MLDLLAGLIPDHHGGGGGPENDDQEGAKETFSCALESRHGLWLSHKSCDVSTPELETEAESRQKCEPDHGNVIRAYSGAFVMIESASPFAPGQ